MERFTSCAISRSVASSSGSIVGSCAYGAIITCPLLYGNVLRITKQCSPRWTTEYFSSSSDSTARQKMHSSAFGARVQSSRQGPQSRSSAIEAARLAVRKIIHPTDQGIRSGADTRGVTRSIAAITTFAVLALPAVASAGGIFGTYPLDISSAPGGQAGNGSSSAPTVSGDNRKTRYAAFQSDATNLVA